MCPCLRYVRSLNVELRKVEQSRARIALIPDSLKTRRGPSVVNQSALCISETIVDARSQGTEESC